MSFATAKKRPVSTTTDPERARMSAGAKALAIAALSIAMSAFPVLRPNIGGLSLHPYLIVVLGMSLNILARASYAPKPMLFGILTFVGFFLLTLLPEGFAPGEAIKMVAGALTILAAPTLVRRERDVVIVTVCLSLAVAVIASRGLLIGAGTGSADMGGINPMKGIGNKNSFSLYALPTLLLAGWMVTRKKIEPKLRWILIGCMIVIVVAIFSSANRSGWLGAVVVGVMLLVGRISIRSIFAVGLVAGGVYFVVGGKSDTVSMMQRRMDQTTGENNSDDIRQELVKAGFRIGVDNPVFGVGPQKVAGAVGRAIGFPPPGVETHNVFAYVVAGCGLLGFSVFLVMLALLSNPVAGAIGTSCQSQFLPPMMMGLWAFRGMFTHEILFSPTFALGVGLSAVLVQLEMRGRKRSQQQKIGQQQRRAQLLRRVAPPAVRVLRGGQA